MAQKVGYNFDSETEFSDYGTYKWVEIEDSDLLMTSHLDRSGLPLTVNNSGLSQSNLAYREDVFSICPLKVAWFD